MVSNPIGYISTSIAQLFFVCLFFKLKLFKTFHITF